MFLTQAQLVAKVLVTMFMFSGLIRTKMFNQTELLALLDFSFV